MTEVTVREMRLRFTGAGAFRAPVEVRAYGRIVGHWFPRGTLPPALAPTQAGGAADGNGRQDLGVRDLQPGAGEHPAAPAAPVRPSMSERQRQRDEWLRKMTAGRRTSGTGY